jgi:hypothetical protein
VVAAMDGQLQPKLAGATTTIVGREPRRLRASIAVGMALVAIAALKPWGSGAIPAPARAVNAAVEQRDALGADRSGQAASNSRPVAVVPAADPATRICGEPLGWRVVTTGLWLSRQSSASIAVNPATAAGPTDSAIPFVVADGNRIDALGWCAPASDRRPSGASTVSAWRIRSGRAQALALALVPGVAGAATGLYAGQGNRTAGSPWPAGRYVFRIENANAATATWFGIEVRIMVAR